jgi:uncharacterized protein with von Willebrand factor type A (vWA) domain
MSRKGDKDRPKLVGEKDRFKMYKPPERIEKKSKYAPPKALDDSVQRMNDTLAAERLSEAAEENEKLTEQLSATVKKNASLQQKIKKMEADVATVEKKNASLTQQIEDMKVEADKRLEKTKTEALQRMARQAEKLRKEFEKIKSSTLHRVSVPAYKLRLLTDFALNYSGCQIMLLEQEGEALLFGQDDECDQAKTELLKLVQVGYLGFYGRWLQP